MKSSHFACFLAYAKTLRQEDDAGTKAVREVVKGTASVMLSKIFTTPHIAAMIVLGEVRWQRTELWKERITGARGLVS